MGIRAGWITLVKPLKRVSAARLQNIDVQIDQSGQIVIKCKHASEKARLHYEVQVCARFVWQMNCALHFCSSAPCAERTPQSPHVFVRSG